MLVKSLNFKLLHTPYCKGNNIEINVDTRGQIALYLKSLFDRVHN